VALADTLTGEALKTSWWPHARGPVIFRVLSGLADHPDVLFHRTRWPALLGAVSKLQPWQLDGLAASGRELLALVNEAKEPIVSGGAAARELETRLLAHTSEVHLKSGKHGVALQRWRLWEQQNNGKPLRAATAAQREIENAVERIGGGVSALPWR